MTDKIRFKNVLARLRHEGNSVVMSVPLYVRETLALKAGDFIAVTVDDGNMVARKVDLTHVIRRRDQSARKEEAK